MRAAEQLIELALAAMFTTEVALLMSVMLTLTVKSFIHIFKLQSMRNTFRYIVYNNINSNQYATHALSLRLLRLGRNNAELERSLSHTACWAAQHVDNPERRSNIAIYRQWVRALM